MLAALFHGAIVFIDSQEETLFPPARRGSMSEDWLLFAQVFLV